MRKDFEKWTKLKSELNERGTRVFFHEREVWFASLGANIGFEEDGKDKLFARPIIIFRKFSNRVFWGIPLTTARRTGKFYLEINLGDFRKRMAIVSQLRLFDAARLYQKIGVIDRETDMRLEEAVIKLCKHL